METWSQQPRPHSQFGSLWGVRICMYIYIYLYVVESKLGPRFGFFESRLGPRWRQNLVQEFLLVLPNFIVFLDTSKKHKQCVGVRKYFVAVCQGVKKGCSKKKCALFVFVFFMLEKEKRETMKKLKMTSKKKNRKLVFWGWLWTKRCFFCRNGTYLKIGKHYLCSEGRKARIFVATISSWEMVLFCAH